MFLTGASLSAVTLFTLASLGRVSAVPPPIEYPEVIPGPRMPSLASLGLTSKDLYEGTASLDERDGLFPRFDLICTAAGCGRTNRNDAQACVNYLRSLGTQHYCGVPGPIYNSITMCSTGEATIFAVNYSSDGGSRSSYCSDVAVGAQTIVNSCTDFDGMVAGTAPAYGNGELLVQIHRNGVC